MNIAISVLTGITLGHEISDAYDDEDTFRKGHRTFYMWWCQSGAIELAFEALEEAFENLSQRKGFGRARIVCHLLSATSSILMDNKKLEEKYPLANRAIGYIRNHVTTVAMVAGAVSAVALTVFASDIVMGGAIFATMGFYLLGNAKYISPEVFTAVDYMMHPLCHVGLILTAGPIMKVWGAILLVDALADMYFRYGVDDRTTYPSEEEWNYQPEFEVPVDQFKKELTEFKLDLRHLNRGMTPYNTFPKCDVHTLIELFHKIDWENSVYKDALVAWVRDDDQFKENVLCKEELEDWVIKEGKESKHAKEGEKLELVEGEKKVEHAKEGEKLELVEGEKKVEYVQEGKEIEYVQVGILKLISGMMTKRTDSGNLDDPNGEFELIGQCIAAMVQEMYDNPPERLWNEDTGEYDRIPDHPYLPVVNVLKQMGTRGWVCATGHIEQLAEFEQELRYSDDVPLRLKLDRALIGIRQTIFDRLFISKIETIPAQINQRIFRINKVEEENKVHQIATCISSYILSLFKLLLDYEGETHSRRQVMVIAGQQIGLWDQVRFSKLDRMNRFATIENKVLQKLIHPLLRREGSFFDTYQKQIVEQVREKIDTNQLKLTDVADWFMELYKEQGLGSDDDAHEWVNEHVLSPLIKTDDIECLLEKLNTNQNLLKEKADGFKELCSKEKLDTGQVPLSKVEQRFKELYVEQGLGSDDDAHEWVDDNIIFEGYRIQDWAIRYMFLKFGVLKL